MINIKIGIEKERKEKISVDSLTATDWLNNIKENKIIHNGKEKNIVSSKLLLPTLWKMGYIEKLGNKKGYIPTEKYLKKGFFEVKDYDVKKDNNKTKKTTYTIHITRKGQRKLLKIVLQLIKDKQKR